MQGVQVQSLVRDLDPTCCVAQSKKKKKKFFLKAKMFRIARGKEFWKLLHDHIDVFNTTELCVSSEK